MSTRALVPAALAIAVAIASCMPARPARFAEATVIADVGDDKPTPLPKRVEPVKEVRLTEAYVKRPMVIALDPTRAPEAGDVNAIDEVPRSTWLSPDEAEAAADAEEAPAPPLRLLQDQAVTKEGALAVMDARGKRFEVWRDPADRPEMATGAAATASRLLRALGYFTPGVWATDLGFEDFAIHEMREHDALAAFFRAGPKPSGGRFRVALTRWPIGTDLGPTPVTGTRADDPNDRVPHENRRTLRALKIFFGWLGLTDLGGGVLRDVYVGAPGRGHVMHYIAGLSSALGASAVIRTQTLRDDDADLEDRNVWVTLGTLGLYHRPPPPTQRLWPSVGEYTESFAPETFHTSPPFDPMDDLLPSDAYWAAKRVATIRASVIARALDAGAYHDPPARTLLMGFLRARQYTAARYGFAQTTPCEVERIEQGSDHTRAAVVMRDQALTLGVVAAETSRYDVEIVNEEGRRIEPRTRLGVSGGPLFAVRLPDIAPAYVVVRVTSLRARNEAPRAMEAHLYRRDGVWKLLGVMH